MLTIIILYHLSHILLLLKQKRMLINGAAFKVFFSLRVNLELRTGAVQSHSLCYLICVYVSVCVPESVHLERQSKVVICLIQCFPPWLRFAQCLRHFWDSGNKVHLLNAGKYSTVFLMVTFAGLYNNARGNEIYVKFRWIISHEIFV